MPKPSKYSAAMTALVGAVSALVLATALAAELRRPDSWAELPKSERPWVWVMDLEYSPEPQAQPPFQGKRIALLPVHNSNSLDTHLEVPPEKFRKEKVLTRLTDEQRTRVLTLQVRSRPSKGKVSSAILISRPFEELLFEAISRELEALGAEVVPSPIETAPITRDSFARLVAELPREEQVDFYLTVKIEDLYCEQFYRCCRTDELGRVSAQIAAAILDTPTYAAPQELIPLLRISYELSLRLADAKAGKVRWEGRSRLDHLTEAPVLVPVMDWWESLVRSSLPELIQKAVRNNEDLHDAIQPITFKIRIPEGKRKIKVVKTGTDGTADAVQQPPATEITQDGSEEEPAAAPPESEADLLPETPAVAPEEPTGSDLSSGLGFSSQLSGSQ